MEFQEWLHRRGSQGDYLIPEILDYIPGVRKGLEKWQSNKAAAQQSRQWRDQMKKPRPADPTTDPNVKATATEFGNRLKVSGPRVNDALIRITAAMIYGLPLEVTIADVRQILDFLWTPDKTTGETVAEKNGITSVNTPNAVIKMYNGLKQAPPYRPDMGEGHGTWAAENGFGAWNKQVNKMPNKFPQWLARAQSAMGGRTAASGASSPLGGGSAKSVDVILGGKFHQSIIRRVKDILNTIAGGGTPPAINPTTPRGKMVAQALAMLTGTPPPTPPPTPPTP